MSIVILKKSTVFLSMLQSFNNQFNNMNNFFTYLSFNTFFKSSSLN